MGGMAVNGGELVVRQLVREGVDLVFSLAGGHLAHVYEACDRHGIAIVDVRHEAAAAHMAEAYGRLTRRPGVCLVTAGPGFTNALTGIQNARMACSPMVVLSGRAGVAQTHRLALQDMNQLDIVHPMTKWAATVPQMCRIPEYISTAFRHARQGQPGPAYLEIPFELVFDETPAEGIDFPEASERLRPAACDTGAVEEALALLARAKRPVIIAGSGAWYAGAGQALAGLVERTHIPLFTLNAARGLVPDSHPDCHGSALPHAIGAASAALPSADVVLLLGTRLSMYLGYGHPPVMGASCKLIQVDVDPTEIGRNRDVELGISGDARSFCETALAVLERKATRFALDAWVASLRKERSRVRRTYEPFLASDQTPIHPLRLAAEVDRCLGQEGIVVADGGDTQAWLSMARGVSREGTYLDTGLFGCLGVGLPFAIAAKRLRPRETVLLFSGDGSMGFNMMEFDTAIRHRLPIIVVVNNDMAWGMIKHGNELTFGRDVDQGSELGLVRYDRIAQALGGYGEWVVRPGEIAGALRRAAAQAVPSCVNVLTDTTAVSSGTLGLGMLMLGAMADHKKK